MQTKSPRTDYGEGADGFFEDGAPVLVVLELVEAGAGRGEENDISRFGRFRGSFDGLF